MEAPVRMKALYDVAWSLGAVQWSEVLKRVAIWLMLTGRAVAFEAFEASMRVGRWPVVGPTVSFATVRRMEGI